MIIPCRSEWDNPSPRRPRMPRVRRPPGDAPSFRFGYYYFALTDLPAERRSLQASMTRSAIEVSAFFR